MAYAEVAAAKSAWAVRLAQIAPATMTAVRAMLELAARTAPLTAYVRGTEDAVYGVTLARDPSRAHGTPPVEDCDRAVREIVAVSSWTVARRTSGTMVAMGLREGYDQDAPVWTLARILESHPDVTGAETRLVAARRVGGDIRWWEEPCALLTPPAVDVRGLDALAGRMRQERYTITDHTNGRTVVRAVTP